MNKEDETASARRQKPLKLDFDGLRSIAPEVDPIRHNAEGFEPETFGDVARRYFSLQKKKPHNLTLQMFEAALKAYFDTGPLPQQVINVAKVLDGMEEKVPKLDAIMAKIDGTLQQVGERSRYLDAYISSTEGAIEGFKASVTESLKLVEARRLWKSTARSARNAYVGSWIALAVLLIGVPATAIWQSDAIFGFFRAIGEAVLVDLPANASETAILIAAVSRLVLVTLPVALYIWLIRIVVRFNMRSLLLMDDANQRNTMLETYLHLVEQDADVKADRPLILEALFRRTPGHGPEAIEPPNLADILRIGNPAAAK